MVEEPPPASADRRRPLRRVVVALDTSIHYGRGVIGGVNAYAMEAGNWSLSLRTRRPPRVEDAEHFAEADGVVLQFEAGMEAALRRLPVPLVNVAAHKMPRRLPTVCTDHRRIGEQAAEHLLERGFVNLAAMAAAEHHGSQRRCEGFVACVEAAGYACALVNAEARRRWLGAWLGEQARPLGVFVYTDALARELAEVAWELGWPIPDELAIVGVDNDPLACDLGHVTLSCVATPLHRIGYEAAKQLDAWMDAGLNAARLPALRRMIEPTGVLVRRSSDMWITGDPLIAAVLAYIREHVDRPFVIDDIAAAVGAERRKMERRFKKQLGQTIGAAITRSRMERAQHLLAGSNDSIGGIARACGFSSVSYFGKVFRRFTGRSPVAYRDHVGVASV